LGENRNKEKIKACVAIAIIVLAILITVIINIKYYVEGETNMPFNLSKMLIVSQVDTVDKTGESMISCVMQKNDIYLSFEKNENNDDEEMIESITIENIQILENPQKGEVKVYMPNSSEGNLFSYKDEYMVSENKLTYKGATKSNNKTLEVGNQGGTIVVSIANTNIGEYTPGSEISEESLLTKVGANAEELKFKASFDVVINLKNKSYIANVVLDLPYGDEIENQGMGSKEITEGIVFRRVAK